MNPEACRTRQARAQVEESVPPPCSWVQIALILPPKLQSGGVRASTGSTRTGGGETSAEGGCPVVIPERSSPASG